MDLFSGEKQHLKLPQAELIYLPNFYNNEKSDGFFKTIKEETNWQHKDITVFGKTYKEPRLTALFGESKQAYGYSNVTLFPDVFTPTLKSIKDEVEKVSECSFNTLLVNLYRNGSDSNGWHADNEKELGTNPIIASISFGEVRPFHFKHRQLKDHRYKLNLEHGSLLIMKGEMQHYWLHQIAKTKKDIRPRINLTFRKLIEV
jgi:alkylated DNA repair dioxygenase AlkB